MQPGRFQSLGPLLAGEGSRAFIGLEVHPDGRASPCVLIWVPEEAKANPTLLQKIRRETEHAASLDHPNIVNVLGYAELEDGPARVVEFADGEMLRRVMESAKKLPTRVAARILVDACTGVHYAHMAGNDDGSPLIHGDLRPETILLSFSGATKVTGYGALAFAPRDAGGPRVKGRRVHSAPEQIIGGREAFTIATDVYLLGLLLYECLTGVAPWADQGDNFDFSVLSHPIPPGPPGDISPELHQVIEKACAKKAMDRYPTPLALREALETAAGEELATAQEVGQYLELLYPESHLVRADRRRTIDAGIADFVRRQWADKEKERAAQAAPTAPTMEIPRATATSVPPPPEPPAPAEPVAPRPAAAAPTLPRKAPAAPRPAPSPSVELSGPVQMPSRFGSPGPWLLLGFVAIGAVGLWYFMNKGTQPLPSARRYLAEFDAGAAEADAGAPAVAIDADAGEQSPDASVADASVADATPPDAGPPVAVATDAAGTIDCSPRVEVLLEGTSLGRTPWKGRLPAGRHRLQLVNKELNLSAGRTITVAAGQPFEESFKFEKGFVGVTAPPGAAIFIDSRRVGTAPLKADLAVYEGFHRIQVNVGKAKWNDSFTLYGSQRVSFTVEKE